MSRRRGATTLRGVLPVDKPAGMTSHDVVDQVRRATGEGRVGHAGTLDPLATGLLVALIGSYTRLEPYLSGARKTYEARIAFGTSTDTDDAEGAVVDAAAVPDAVMDPHAAQTALDALLGDSMQAPPAYSAIKVGGRVSHRAARAGETLELAPRAITVDAAELLRIDADARTWDVRFRVSKGTYVRALARDLGLACGTFAHLGALRRTAAGLLTLDDANDLDDIVAASAEGHLAALFTDVVAALGLPVAEASATEVANGRALDAGRAIELPEGALASVLADGAFHGVYTVVGGALVPASIVGGTA
jgi:tRNA pseudouridine55 synthase